MTCDPEGVIWPAPTGQLSLSQELINFLPQNLKVIKVVAPSETVSNMVNQAVDIFRHVKFFWNIYNGECSKTLLLVSKGQ